MTIEELVERLASHRTLGAAPREELAWIAAHAELRVLEPGALISRMGEVVEGLVIMLSGRATIRVDRGAGRRKVMEWRGGDVTGVLPYSRTWMPPGDSVVDEHAEILFIARADLPKMIHACYEVTSILVHVMTDRARQFTKSDLHDEKLLSLSTLAAGLAHELNNPASAAMRGAKSLSGVLMASEEAARALGAARPSEAQLLELDAVRDVCMREARESSLGTIALAEREDGIALWLESHGADAGAAEPLSKTGVTIEALDRLALCFQGKALDAALRWISAACTARALTLEIERATSRIHALVAAVKGFTQMDRALTPAPVDIAKGLSDTLTVLEGKARAKSVHVSMEVAPDLPRVFGYAAECNQIWEKLIDNALDAVADSGRVAVTAEKGAGSVVVCVTDDGPGISAAIRERIFEPFFTTKSVGLGTGLGLDIVRRLVQWHDGEIDVESQPGRTVFRVRLPLAGPDPAGNHTVSR
ncbi:MAG TPA: ATP-binding protein [Bacteroidota bacterium]|nr:ATP-binding protein [Bacteroidota bacterium]